ncbi:hypothetical protein [Streptomyces sp. IMTB 2501]|nr:hypothetical protein [Streptomyces sp. IMTB 2501]
MPVHVAYERTRPAVRREYCPEGFRPAEAADLSHADEVWAVPPLRPMF